MVPGAAHRTQAKAASRVVPSRLLRRHGTQLDSERRAHTAFSRSKLAGAAYLAQPCMRPLAEQCRASLAAPETAHVKNNRNTMQWGIEEQ